MTLSLLYRTEMIKNNLNPVFVKTIQLVYQFEQVQNLRFLVYDVDNGTSTLDDDDFIGSMDCMLAEIAGSRGMTLTRNLKSRSGKITGSITITADELKQNTEVVTIQFRGIKLPKKDLFGKSDPWFSISKPTTTGNNIDVYKSEIIMRNLNPTWKPFGMSTQKLCNSDPTLPLKFMCYDYDKYSAPDFIGETKFSLNDLIAKSRDGGVIPLVDNTKGKNKAAGHIAVPSLNITRDYSFIEYLQGGCEISLIVSVDFTASNKDPRDPTSLHYQNPHQMNEYEKAIRSTGDILAYYDRDNMFPAFGFGAKFNNGQVSHNFALNGNPQDPQCFGINGILAAYKQAINSVQLYGPTNFAETIRVASQYASRYIDQNNQHYFVLLIITDGAISDVNETINAIIDASSLPLSIVIVGVGNADFSTMDYLDSDQQMLSNGRATAKRDIVQFVQFNKFANQHYSALAAETLAEIPQQLTQFMRLRNIKPNQKIVVPPPQMEINQTAPLNIDEHVGVHYNPDA
jgi:hypothetical protein